MNRELYILLIIGNLSGDGGRLTA